MSERYRRRRDVLWRRAGACVLALGADDSSDVIRLDGTGVVLWDLLDDAMSIEELSATLAAAFSAPVDHVRRDVTPALDELVRSGVVVVEPT